MKKVLALVLAFMMIFSSISFTFADTTTEISAAKACETLGMLQGSGTGVTAEYLAGESTRLQAAIMVLRLMGLEKEAVAYVSDKNFADMATYAWADGKNVAGYLLAHPELGFVGDGVNFMPNAKVDEAQYYKVMLTALGYTQDVDYTWAEVITFAKSLGFAPQAPASFTNNDIARITMEALQAKNKAGVVLFKAMIAAGSMTEAKATEAGLIVPVTAALDSVTAIGNTVVEVVFDGDVEAADAALYTIDGLTVKSALAAGSDTVRLTTDAMTAGKLYTLTVNDEKAKFTGIAKDSDKPAIEAIKSEDLDQVVVTFDNVDYLDYEAATDVANYTITGVEVVNVELDGNEVTLTTKGLTNKKQYSLKVTNIKSVDGYVLKSESKSFYTRYDLAAPTVTKATATTNQKVVVVFNEQLSKESAENVANYVIKTGTTELAIEKAELVESDDVADLYNTVELTTEAQKSGTRYTLVISNISDDSNSANTMAKPVTKYVTGQRADEKDPILSIKPYAVSKNDILLAFNDGSDMDEATVLDVNNYTLKKGTDELSVESAVKVYTKNGDYMVNLTVEDLELGSYSLKTSNIADEFGNVMDDKTSYFTVTRDTYSSAKVISYKVSASNKVVLTFDKPLVEATAEDIANYTFDGDLGTPKEVVYSTSAKTVTITTNGFTFNKQYKITVKDVEDIAGNILSFNFKFYAAYGTAVAPELSSVYAVNQYVVAVAFDDTVDTYTNTKLTLEDVNGVKPDVVLFGKALTEDDTVIEFSNYVPNALVASNLLSEDVTYKVASLTGTIKGVGGKLFVAPTDLNSYLVYGTTDKPERAEVVNVEQIDGVSYQITMSKNVVDEDGTAPGTSRAIDADYDMVVDADDNTLVTITKDSAIKDTDEDDVNLSSLLVDEHGFAVLDQDEEDGGEAITTKLYPEYEDTDTPYILNVTALNRKTVQVEYSEDVMQVAPAVYDYKIVNADSDIKTIYNVTEVKFDGAKVKLTLATALEGRYDYTLIVDKTKAYDLAKNPADEISTDEFYFNGSDLTPVGTPEDLNKMNVVAQDFSVYTTETLNGYSIGFGLVNAKASDVKAVEIKMYDEDGALLATATANELMTQYPTLTSLSAPFDVYGSFDYAADKSWNYSEWATGAEEIAPATAVITVTFTNDLVKSVETAYEGLVVPANGNVEGDGQPSSIVSVTENSTATKLYVTFSRPVYIYSNGGYDPVDVDMWNLTDVSAEGVQIESITLSSNHLVATLLLSGSLGTGDAIRAGDFHTIDMRCMGYPRTATRDADGNWNLEAQAYRAMGAESNHISE